MALDRDDIAIRCDVWEKANEMVGPLIEEHGVKDTTIGTIFSTADVISPLDQHITAIIRVSDWLIGKDY